MHNFRFNRRWTWEWILGNSRRLVEPFKPAAPWQDPTAYFRNLGLSAYDQKHLAGNEDLFADACSRLLRPVINVSAVGKILDLGCGDGALLARLPLNGSEITLVDCSDAHLKVAHARLLPTAKSIMTINEDIRKWNPAITIPYSLVLSVNVIPYIEDLEEFLYLCRAVTAPGGYLLIAGPAESRVWESEFEGVRVLFHTSSKINQAANKVGFRTVEHSPIGFCLPLWPRPIIVGFVTVFQL